MIAAPRTSERAFLGGSALLFTASVALTIVWSASMSAMGEMPMPGDWTMSMAWMRMPGQTWPGTAASFLGMWVVMMVAMMLPSLLPMLWHYRQAVGRIDETRLDRLTALVGIGYFFVWTIFGMTAFTLGVALAAIEMQQAALARAVPIGVGVIVLIAGAFQFTSWKARHLACCREAPGPDRYFAGRRQHGLATRPAPRSLLQLLQRRSDGHPSDYRGHGPSRDGCRGGSDHDRTSRTGW